MAAMPQENERGLGNWQAELAEWPDLVIAVHGSTSAMATALEGLQVFAERMRANIDATHGLVFAEAASALLSDALPPGVGAALVQELCSEIGAAAQKAPQLQDLLLKAIARRTALRGKVSATQVRAVFAVEPKAARLALRTRSVLDAVVGEATEKQAAKSSPSNPPKRAASAARKPIRRREGVS